MSPSLASFRPSSTGRGPVQVDRHDPVSGPSAALVVMLPGLGLPSYLTPTAMSLSARGTTSVVLDLPGFGCGTRACAANVHAVGLAAAGWVRRLEAARPVVVVGHSTGAQAALTASLALQEVGRDVSTVLAGPTFAPRQRRLATVTARAPAAYRDDTRGELVVVPEILRGRLGVLGILRSGLRDRPELRVSRLRGALTLTAGVHDAYAPESWLHELAAAAVSADPVRVAVLAGSHNNPFTHPDEVADVILGHL